MAYYTHSDSKYDNYDSWTNALIHPNENYTEFRMNKQFVHTDITARDKKGNITFHHREKGKMTDYSIKRLLMAMRVKPSKEEVTINYLTL